MILKNKNLDKKSENFISDDKDSIDEVFDKVMVEMNWEDDNQNNYIQNLEDQVKSLSVQLNNTSMRNSVLQQKIKEKFSKLKAHKKNKSQNDVDLTDFPLIFNDKFLQENEVSS
jgi:chromosome segregation ATPase